jgi:hypothetical protein
MKRNLYKVIIIGLIVIIAAGAIYWLIDHFIKKKGGPKLLEPSAPAIAELLIDPLDPQSTDFIRVEPVFKDSWILKEAIFKYLWVVNGDEIRDNNDTLLDKKFYKKGDSVYCVVVVMKGEYKSDPIKSKEVKVRNSAPILNCPAIQPFNVPGEFEYRVVAEDPDGDSMTYRLLSPLNLGIVLNSETGVIKWYITNGAPPYVTIIFEAIDSEGVGAKGSIELNTSSGKEITQ